MRLYKASDLQAVVTTARDVYIVGQLKPKRETCMKASIIVTSVRVVGPFQVEVGFEDGSIHQCNFKEMPLEGIFRKAQTDLAFANSAALDCGDLAFERGKWTLDSDFIKKHSQPTQDTSTPTKEEPELLEADQLIE